MALNVEDGAALVEEAERAGRNLMVGHVLEYHPAILELRRLVSEGELGRVFSIRSNRLNFGRIRTQENALWSFAPHDIALILRLIGGFPTQISCHGGYHLDRDVADSTLTHFEFSSGVQAQIFVSWLHPFKEQKLMVIGDRKMIVFDDVVEDDKLVIYPHTIDWKKLIPVVHKAVSEPVAYEMEEPLKAECRHFLECIRTRQRPRTDGEEGLKVLRVLQQCQEGL